MTLATGDPATRERILGCARAAGIGADELGEIVPSWSQHTVMVGDGRVLRVCWLGNTDRLLAESLLLRELPVSLGSPTVLAFGRVDGLTWAVSSRMPGRTLAAVWPDLTLEQRDAAAVATADLVAQLYEHRPSAEVTHAVLSVPNYQDLLGHGDLLGGAMLGWPLPRVRGLLADPRSVLRGDQKQRILDGLVAHPDLVPRVDSPELPVIHGDLHASNIWWQDDPGERFDGVSGRVTGLFDLEWARFAEPWADYGRSHERALADVADGRDCHQHLIPGIQRSLPAWQVSDERLLVSSLGYTVREALLWEPLGPDSPGDHVVPMVDGLLAQLGW
ncbi:phosphotransferase family protein [Aestuariimicrobium sp. T2.26MG-19.2B]|uniref:phosphotransferase family protein n=1 Tax=Aestuariimicrobium sp. T2.26MG-19.2B TaxID=3040679 RepID=UPI00247740D0|nr:phosphotransferase [Aestuariimicrobium sp. T2.26MG-19.2B]CAI9405749.1 hypothetical protein AESSP_01478 [Aestuariimicrobium sp. T2.26MG-19.2B]